MPHNDDKHAADEVMTWRRKLAVEAYNASWELLDKGDARTAADDRRMEHLAHTSRLLWELAGGGPAHLARGEWQIAWVYAQLGQGLNALRFAEACRARCEEGPSEGGFQPFDLPSAYQALVAAHAVLGHTEARDRFVGLAEAAVQQIDDADDRALLLDQIAQARSLPPAGG